MVRYDTQVGINSYDKYPKGTPMTTTTDISRQQQRNRKRKWRRSTGEVSRGLRVPAYIVFTASLERESCQGGLAGSAISGVVATKRKETSNYGVVENCDGPGTTAAPCQ